MKVYSRNKKYLNIHAILLLLVGLLVPLLGMAASEDDDEFLFIDTILGRKGNALATNWEGVYFGGAILYDKTKYSFNVDNLQNAGVTQIQANRYNNVYSNSVNSNKPVVGIVLGRNYVDSNFLVGIETVLSYRVGDQKQIPFDKNLWIATDTDNANPNVADQKNSRSAQSYSDQSQTNVRPQGWVTYNNGFDLKCRLGYIDEDVLYFATIGYSSSNWNVSARANVTTVFITGSNIESIVEKQEIVRGWTTSVGIEFALTPDVFSRVELTNYNYPSFSSYRVSNQVKFDFKQTIASNTIAMHFVYNFK
ncbi:MAG: hypothetical protein QM538_07410 [Methylacidiphilales bacterium]|nr:hypothetical protein [Candidatus Methylacidiphilales bacterium]